MSVAHVLTLDDRNQAILTARIKLLDEEEGPRVGDYVEFSNGVTRRVSYIWFGERVQTSDAGSFYLGNGYVSFSGSLHDGVPRNTLVRTEAKRLGSVWFFRNDYHQANNALNVEIEFRVYKCELEAPL